MDDFKLLSKNSEEIGGDGAISYVDKSYIGNCEVIVADGSSRSIAILPNLEEAERVACYAITPDGGYSSTEVHSTKLSVTNKSFNDWFS